MSSAAYAAYQASSIFSSVTTWIGELFSAGLGLLTSTGLCGKGSFKAREYGGVKKFLRMVGVDQFDDFEFLLVVHDVSFEYAKQKFNTEVRVKAGEHSVVTSESSNGSFQQPFSIFVEQGTQTVRVELIDKSRQRVVSVLDLDVQKDIIQAAVSEPVHLKLYTMTQKNKAVINPRIRLSIEIEDSEAAEAGLLQEQGHEMANDPMGTLAETPEQQRLVNSLQGTLQLIDGRDDNTVFMAVVGPPHHKRYFLTLSKDEQTFLDGGDYEDSIDLLKIRSVQASRKGQHVFEVNYAKEGASDKRQLLLASLDRPRDDWTEPLIELIEARHESRASKRQSQSA